MSIGLKLRSSYSRRLPFASPGFACIALALGGCASGISTPLPDVVRTPVASSVSQQDHQKAVDELQRAGRTHEQDAEKQIESSR